VYVCKFVDSLCNSSLLCLDPKAAALQTLRSWRCLCSLFLDTKEVKHLVYCLKERELCMSLALEVALLVSGSTAC